MPELSLAELGAELGIRAGRAVFAARGTASSPITVASGSSSPTYSRVSTPSPTPPRASTPAPSTPSRTRAVPVYSPLAATANTPPRSPARMHRIHPFFVRRAAPPTPNRPRCVADYTSTSESGASVSGSSVSGSSVGDSLDSPLMSPPSASPIPSSRVLSTPSSTDAASNHATRLLAAMRARKAVRAAAVSYPGTPVDELESAMSSLDLTQTMPHSRKLYRIIPRPPSSSAEDVFSAAEVASGSAEDHDVASSSNDLHQASSSTNELNRSNSRPRAPSASDTLAPVEDAAVGSTAQASASTTVGEDVKPSASGKPTLSAQSAVPSASADVAVGTPPVTRVGGTGRHAARGASRVEPSNRPYFSVSRPLPGHFDRPPNVVYTRDASEADDLVACLRGPLGFDLEWPPPGIGPVLTRKKRDGSVSHYRQGQWDGEAKRYVWPQGRTAVIQIADQHTVVVYHLPTNGTIGPGLQELLFDGSRIKTGVNIGSDGRKLWRDKLVPNTAGMFELSHIAHLIDPEIWTRSSRLVSLARLTEHYLGVPLDKSEGIREGAWNEDLNAEQIEYAANDAYVGVLIYNAMVRRAAERGMEGELEQLRIQMSIPQFPPPVVELAKQSRTHPAVVAAERAGAQPRHTLALAVFIAGGSVSELASALSISPRTVQGYVATAALHIPPDKYEGYIELAVRLVEAFPRDSYPATAHAEFFRKLRRIAKAVDIEERVPIYRVNEYEWGHDD